MFSFSKEEKGVNQEVVEVVDEKKPELCDECKEAKPIYKVDLCEECYVELFK